MPRHIFPTLGIPTIYVAQPYGGMDPAQMEGFLTYFYEYHFLYITGIEHVESKSIQGASIMKLQFHSGTDMSQAMAETVGYVNRSRAFMPPGTVPPFEFRDVVRAAGLVRDRPGPRPPQYRLARPAWIGVTSGRGNKAFLASPPVDGADQRARSW